MNKLFSLSLILIFSGCSLSSPPENRVVVRENAVPGTVAEPWFEPMHDSVKVPAQLDPTGTYFRPEHKTIVEIRPGRVQPLQYPDSDNGSDKTE